MARLASPLHLPLSDQSALRAIVKKGAHKSRTITRANALLLMGAGGRAAAVQAQVSISSAQYHRIKRRYLAGGLAEALVERPRSGQPLKVTPALEAHITRLACSETPATCATHSNFTTPPSTAPGSTGPKSNSPPFPVSASTDASAPRNDSSKKPWCGRPNETRRPLKSIGPSPPKTPETS